MCEYISSRCWSHGEFLKCLGADLYRCARSSLVGEGIEKVLMSFCYNLVVLWSFPVLCKVDIALCWDKRMSVVASLP